MESLLASTLQQLETDMQAAEAHAAGSSGHGAGSSGHGAGSSGVGGLHAGLHHMGGMHTKEGLLAGHQTPLQSQLPVLLLRFFRSSFELLEGVKVS